MDSYIEIDGVQLRVSQSDNYPNRPTIVFLHDSYGCIDLWRDFPEELCKAAKCNKLVYDRQGYGKSDPVKTIKRGLNYLELEADILYKLLNKLNVENAIIFGHSDGGSIGLIAAAKYSEKVIGLITEGAHVFVEDISYEGLKQALIDYNTTNLKEKLTKYHDEKAENVFWAWMNTWSSEEFSTWNIEHILPNIKCSVLVIQGEYDEYGSYEQVKAIVKGIGKNAKEAIIKGGKHSPHKTHSIPVLNKIREFTLSIKY